MLQTCAHSKFRNELLTQCKSQRLYLQATCWIARAVFRKCAWFRGNSSVAGGLDIPIQCMQTPMCSNTQQSQ